MEAFETIVKTLLHHDGFWVTEAYKVSLSKEEKIAIGRPSAPRWEIDLLAYRGATNQAFAVECKSFLDSAGVDYGSMQAGSRYASYYKLFNEPELRSIVLKKIQRQLVESQQAPPGVTVTLGLAAGCVYSPKDDRAISDWFSREGWLYLSPSEISTKLVRLATTSYFNDVAIMATKILERNRA